VRLLAVPQMIMSSILTSDGQRHSPSESSIASAPVESPDLLKALELIHVRAYPKTYRVVLALDKTMPVLDAAQPRC
jgi:hypothetical protein